MNRYMLNEITAAIVAVSVVSGGVIITLVTLLERGQLADLPSWLATAVGAVIGFYFGQRRNGVSNP